MFTGAPPRTPLISPRFFGVEDGVEVDVRDACLLLVVGMANGDGEAAALRGERDDLRLGEREAQREEVLRDEVLFLLVEGVRRRLAAHREDEHALEEDDGALRLAACRRRARR